MLFCTIESIVFSNDNKSNKTFTDFIFKLLHTAWKENQFLITHAGNILALRGCDANNKHAFSQYYIKHVASAAGLYLWVLSPVCWWPAGLGSALGWKCVDTCIQQTAKLSNHPQIVSHALIWNASWYEEHCVNIMYNLCHSHIQDSIIHSFLHILNLSETSLTFFKIFDKLFGFSGTFLR